MITIQLSQGQQTIVDDESFDKISEHHWYADFDKKLRKYYVKSETKRKGTRNKLKLHRFLMDAKEGEVVDHLNGDTLDNRLCNLRRCTVAQNAMNRSLNKNNTSGYKGVVWHTQALKYQARISVNSRWKSLGMYSDKKVAALAYNEAAKLYYGEFAKLNVIE